MEVFTPQQDEELVSDISLIVESETSTASKFKITLAYLDCTWLHYNNS